MNLYITKSLADIVHRSSILLVFLKNIMQSSKALINLRILLQFSDITIGFRNLTKVNIICLIYNHLIQLTCQRQNNCILFSLINRIKFLFYESCTFLNCFLISKIHSLTKEIHKLIVHLLEPPFLNEKLQED